MSEPSTKYIDFKALVESLDPDRHRPILVYEFQGQSQTRKFFEEELKPGETYPWAK